MKSKLGKTILGRVTTLQFSLRGMFVLLTVTCVWVAIVAEQRRREEEAVVALLELDCKILFDVDYTQTPPNRRMALATYRKPKQFQHAAVIYLSPQNIKAALPHLKKLPRLREVSIYSGGCISGRDVDSEQEQRQRLIREFPSIKVTEWSINVVG